MVDPNHSQIFRSFEKIARCGAVRLLIKVAFVCGAVNHRFEMSRCDDGQKSDFWRTPLCDVCDLGYTGSTYVAEGNDVIRFERLSFVWLVVTPIFETGKVWQSRVRGRVS